MLVDEGSEGQRLDNFLVKLLKGVPKTHVYRVIRSGEVRVPPVRVADRTEVPAAPAREFPVVYEDDALLVIDTASRNGTRLHGQDDARVIAIEGDTELGLGSRTRARWRFAA